MTLNSTTLVLLLATGGFAIASPAQAQYNTPTPAPTIQTPQNTAQAPAKGDSGYKPSISNAARKEIVALEAAVKAKNTAAIPAAVAAAQAKAKTKDDRYVIGQLQLRAAIDANDNAGIIQGIEAVLAADVLPPSEALRFYNNLGQLHYNAKAYDKAAAALEKVLQLDPNNVDATVTLAETRNSQGRSAEAVVLIRKAIAARVAAGQKPDENWYKRAVALAYKAQLPAATDVAREWVSAYPTSKNWREAIAVYQRTSGLDDASMLDSMRLARVTGALTGENDYFRYTNTLVSKGFPGEAKAVLEQGFAAKSIDRSKATFSQLYSLASARSQGDQASLAASATAAKAAPDAKKAMVTAEAYYGYGDYAKAAELFRVALTKPGVDKDLASLRLGMALAQAGDKAGAAAAFNAAGGAQADVAKLWLTYLALKA